MYCIFEHTHFNKSLWKIICCKMPMKRNNGRRGGVCVHVMMVLLCVRVNVGVYETTPVGQTGFCSQTASCHNPITFPFPACPVVLFLCALFKYHRKTYTPYARVHALTRAHTHTQTNRCVHTHTNSACNHIIPPSMKYSFRQGIYTS